LAVLSNEEATCRARRRRAQTVISVNRTFCVINGDSMSEKKEHLPHPAHVVVEESGLHLFKYAMKKLAGRMVTPGVYKGTEALPFFGGLLRPVSPWVLRAAPKVAAIGKVVGHAGLLVDALQSTNNTPGSSWERNQNKLWNQEQRRLEAIKYKTTPRVEQGIAYKDGTVHWPQSHQWDFRPTTISLKTTKRPPTAASRIGPQPLGKVGGLSLGTPKLQIRPAVASQPRLGSSPGSLRLSMPRLGQSMPFQPIRPSLGRFQLRAPSIAQRPPIRATGALGKVGALNLGNPALRFKTVTPSRPPALTSAMKLSLPKLGTSMPFKAMAKPSLGGFRLRPPTMRFK
jgi:hypothetical protein